MRLIGIVLIVLGVLGVLALAYGGFSYTTREKVVDIGPLQYGGFSYTTREKVVDIGPLQATALTHKTIPVAPIVGIAALAGGLALVFLVKPTRD